MEFADFKVSVITPPAGTEQATDPNAGGAGSGEEEDELEADEPEEEMASAAEPDPSTLCKTKPTCLERSTWCTTTFATDVPSDCTENFGE